MDVIDVATFGLILARTTGWVAVVPVLGAGTAGTTVGRVAAALALAAFATTLTPAIGESPDVVEYFVLLGGQLVYGLVLGWLTALVFMAFEAAGAAIDLFSGLSVMSVLNPATGGSSAVIANFFRMAFLAAVFATDAHLMIIGGFLRSFDASPPTELPILAEDSALAVGDALATTLLSALEIGAPVLGALLLAEVAVAIAARFAPQANVFLVGMPLKVLVALSALSGVLLYLPVYAERIAEASVRIGVLVS
jgi:flagellar biosynthetic protein FliR